MLYKTIEPEDLHLEDFDTDLSFYTKMPDKNVEAEDKAEEDTPQEATAEVSEETTDEAKKADTRKKTFMGEAGKGLIILEPYDAGYIVLYMYVQKDMRRQGISKDLLESALAYCEENKYMFIVKIIFTNDYSKFLVRFAQEHNLKEGPSMHLHLMDRRQTDMDAVWKKLEKKLAPLQQHYARAGYTVSLFNETPEIVRKNLDAAFHVWNESREVPMDMYPFIKDMYQPLSFICYKGEDPIAYMVTERYGDSLVIKEQLVLKSHWGGPGFLLTLYPFIDKLVAAKDIIRVTYMNLSTNKKAVESTQRYYSAFVYETIEQTLYIKNFA